VTRGPTNTTPRVGLTVVRADAADADAVEAAIDGNESVLSALGVAYTPKLVSVYSQGARNIVAGMRRRGVRRLVVVSSAPLDPGYQASDSFVFTRFMEPLFMRKPGRTVYEDMRRMEALIQASDLDWTIVRSCWLFDSPAVTSYSVREHSADGMFTARADLAACMLAQLSDGRYVRKIIGVNTAVGTPSIVEQIWREVIPKPKKSRSAFETGQVQAA
jgi:putative NADH-flavin reductase